ncbi:MAG: pilus assembly protein PilM [Firmicutes bacterium]|nr:pilus assembly protein PilM [Bacillota bacterium]
MVTIVEFGSSKISIISGSLDFSDKISVKASFEIEYAGYTDSKFSDSKKLATKLEQGISEISLKMGERVKEIYVGVPAEFSYCVCREANLDFKKVKRITEADIITLSKSGLEFNDASYELISIAPIFFMVDNHKKVVQPLGMQGSLLSGLFSYSLAYTSFTNFIRQTFNALGVKTREFIPVTLAQSLYLVPPEIRDNYCIVIDCGALDTHIALSRGEGVLYFNNFALGGAHFNLDLMRVFDVGYELAEELKRKVNLSLALSEGENYEVYSGGRIYEFDAHLANDVILARLYTIIDAVKNTLANSTFDYPPNTPIFLTGGGLSHLRGARVHIEEGLDKSISLVSANSLTNNKPNQSAAMSVLWLALRESDSEKDEARGLVAFINKKLGR